MKILLAGATCLAAGAALAAGHAHVHGLAKLDIAVEASRMVVQLDTPLDNLIGFEHAPRTDAERVLAADAVARLQDAATMFRIDPAAQCRPGRIELASAPLNLGRPDPEEARDGHADLDGSFEFDCVDATKAAWVEVGLFGFARLQGLQVQVATPQGQFRRDLKRPALRIGLRK